MGDQQTGAGAQPVSLAEHFTRSQKFRDLFSHGMDLVEETAAFLDNEGRQYAQELPKPVQSVYGTESMRLTTRLMQLASWLLLQRAVAEGEMSVDQAIAEKTNVKLDQLQSFPEQDLWDDLPDEFTTLVDRSLTLQRRIIRLDQEIYSAPPEPEETANPVAAQRDLLATAFDKRFAQ